MKIKLILTWLIILGISGVTIAESYVPSGYSLTFSDEFDFLSLNPDADENHSGKWITYWKDYNIRNLECNNDQAFKADASFYNNGATLGVVLHETTNGSLKLYGKQTPPDKLGITYRAWGDCSDPNATSTLPYLGGMISSELSHSQLYGYWECRAKFDTSQGHHWGMWLLPKDKSAPPEIDIVEVVGLDTNIAHMNAHKKHPIPGIYSCSEPGDFGVNTQNYHTYGFEWTPTTMRWYIDGDLKHEVENYISDPMYFLISPEIGGNWPGPVGSNTIWPMKAEIDFVSVYEYNGNYEDDIPYQQDFCNEIIVMAESRNGSGGTLELHLDDQKVANWQLTNSLTPYTHNTTAGFNNVKVWFLDENEPESTFVDYVSVNGNIFQSENEDYNTGAWNNQIFQCGCVSSELIECWGFIDYGNHFVKDAYGTCGETPPDNDCEAIVTIRAAASGWAAAGGTIELQIDNTAVASFNLSYNMQDFIYTVPNFSSGNIKVHFLDDAGDAQIDHLRVNGTTYQAEEQPINTGVWNNATNNCGGAYAETIHCNGYILFENIQNNSDCEGGNKDCPADLTLNAGDNVISGATVNKSVSNEIEATNTIFSEGNATYIAGNRIVLKPGFKALLGSYFNAFIEACTSPKLAQSKKDKVVKNNDDIDLASLSNLEEEFDECLQIYPNPMEDKASIIYHLKDEDNITLTLFDATGKHLTTLAKNQPQIAGQHQLKLDATNLPTGIYYFKLQSNKISLTKKLMIAK